MTHKASDHSILVHIDEFEKNGDSRRVIAENYIKKIEEKVMEKLTSGFFKFYQNIFYHNSFALPNIALLAEMSKVDIKYNVLRIEVDVLPLAFLVLLLQKFNQFQSSKLTTHYTLNDFK